MRPRFLKMVDCWREGHSSNTLVPDFSYPQAIHKPIHIVIHRVLSAFFYAVSLCGYIVTVYTVVSFVTAIITTMTTSVFRLRSCCIYSSQSLY